MPSEVLVVIPSLQPKQRANILGLGLLASAIIKMEGVGNLSGWRWIFILEGIATVIIAFIAWLMMPADLGSAKFFTEEERHFASESPIRTPSWHLESNIAIYSMAIPCCSGHRRRSTSVGARAEDHR